MTTGIQTYEGVSTSSGPSAGVKLVLQMEGAAALIASAFTYRYMGENWWVFAALFLAPDLSMLGYLAGRRLGAFAYNCGHSYIGPALLAGGLYWLGRTDLTWLVLIWTAHIGFDRMLGYGLKSSTGFNDTHLGRVGRKA